MYSVSKALYSCLHIPRKASVMGDIVIERVVCPPQCTPSKFHLVKVCVISEDHLVVLHECDGTAEFT
jgi:hypothetical protein